MNQREKKALRDPAQKKTSYPAICPSSTLATINVEIPMRTSTLVMVKRAMNSTACTDSVFLHTSSPPSTILSCEWKQSQSQSQGCVQKWMFKIAGRTVLKTGATGHSVQRETHLEKILSLHPHSPPLEPERVKTREFMLNYWEMQEHPFNKKGSLFHSQLNCQHWVLTLSDKMGVKECLPHRAVERINWGSTISNT